ncbi:hypothetical protein HYS31_04390 [Candidatus Woesearchaeota archaeon]|nr:hypothetical protein [Candidatus Woesearchaeota archaeon]
MRRILYIGLLASSLFLAERIKDPEIITYLPHTVKQANSEPRDSAPKNHSTKSNNEERYLANFNRFYQPQPKSPELDSLLKEIEVELDTVRVERNENPGCSKLELTIQEKEYNSIDYERNLIWPAEWELRDGCYHPNLLAGLDEIMKRYDLGFKSFKECDEVINDTGRVKEIMLLVDAADSNAANFKIYGAEIQERKQKMISMAERGIVDFFNQLVSSSPGFSPGECRDVSFYEGNSFEYVNWMDRNLGPMHPHVNLTNSILIKLHDKYFSQLSKKKGDVQWVMENSPYFEKMFPGSISRALGYLEESYWDWYSGIRSDQTYSVSPPAEAFRYFSKYKPELVPYLYTVLSNKPILILKK